LLSLLIIVVYVYAKIMLYLGKITADLGFFSKKITETANQGHRQSLLYFE